MLDDFIYLVPDTCDQYIDGDSVVTATGPNLKLLLAISIGEMELDPLACARLRKRGVVNLGGLSSLTKEDIESVTDAKTAQFIEGQLADGGLVLGMNFCPSVLSTREVTEQDLRSCHVRDRGALVAESDARSNRAEPQR